MKGTAILVLTLSLALGAARGEEKARTRDIRNQSLGDGDNAATTTATVVASAPRAQAASRLLPRLELEIEGTLVDASGEEASFRMQYRFEGDTVVVARIDRPGYADTRGRLTVDELRKLRVAVTAMQPEFASLPRKLATGSSRRLTETFTLAKIRLTLGDRTVEGAPTCRELDRLDPLLSLLTGLVKSVSVRDASRAPR